MTDTENFLQILLLDSRQKEFESVISLLAEINAIENFPYSFELLYTKGITKGVELLQKQRIDLVLLDVSTAKGKALASISQIRDINPSMPIITLMQNDDPDFAHSIIESGAHDAFAMSALTPTDFANCICQVLDTAKK